MDKNRILSGFGQSICPNLHAHVVCHHFRVSCGEGDWLDGVGSNFVAVPVGAKRRRVQDEPFCVLGGLAMPAPRRQPRRRRARRGRPRKACNAYKQPTYGAIG